MTIFFFVSIVIFNPLLVSTLQISYLTLSISFGVCWNTPRPSSLYKSICFLMPSSSWFNIYETISSQVSAPLKEPIVKSNEIRECFLLHGVLSLNNSDCLVWKIIFPSPTEMSV